MTGVQGCMRWSGTQQCKCPVGFLQNKGSRASCNVQTYKIGAGSLFCRVHEAHASTVAGCSITNCWGTITLQLIVCKGNPTISGSVQKKCRIFAP
jgi:hypothetical protein